MKRLPMCLLCGVVAAASPMVCEGSATNLPPASAVPVMVHPSTGIIVAPTNFATANALGGTADVAQVAGDLLIVSQRVDTVEGWGDHALGGYAGTATVAQVAGDLLIVSQRVDTVEGWGDHKTNGYLKAETNPIYVASLSSGSSMIVDAATNTIVDLTLTNNVVLIPPTNAPNARKLQWRIRADGGDYTVAMTNAAFRIPAAASMTNVVTVSNATTSIVLMDYHSPTDKWFIEAYVWGY